MKVKKIALSWVVVKDLEKAKNFFRDIVGLKLSTEDTNYGWLELDGHEGGSTLGVGISDPHNPIPAGANAVVTFTVDNIVEARKDLEQKGVNLLGDIMEIPGHVKLQSFTDEDGNLFQLVESLSNE